MIRALPGQMDLPACEHRPAQHLQRRVEAPLLPGKPQLPCDIGLFGDEAAQLDLVEMLQEPTND